MLSLDEGEVKLFSKYWGRGDLVHSKEFWKDVYEYYSKEVHDAPLPMMLTPQTLRIVREMLVCPSGQCGKCCYYRHIQLNDYDIRRIVENTQYTEKYMKKLITTEGDKMVMCGYPDGCPFLSSNACTIYDFRPDACYIFPFSTKDVMLEGGKVKQLQVRIRCKPALTVARKIITEVMSKGDKILLPDLTIIPKVETV